MSLHKSHVAEKAADPNPGSSYYHTRQTEVLSRTSEMALRPSKYQLHEENSIALSQEPPDLSLPASSTTLSANNTPANAVKKENVKDLPLTLLHSISSPSSASPSVLVTSTPPSLLSAPCGRSRTPLLAGLANSNALPGENPGKTLRRKAPSVEQYVSSLGRSGLKFRPCGDAYDTSTASRSWKSLPECFRESGSSAFLGVASSVPTPSSVQPNQCPGELPPALIPELKALAAESASNRAASSKPDIPSISSPSTQHSGSTGPRSSRDTTPTSLSSCSPGMVQWSRTKTTSRPRSSISFPHKAEDTPVVEIPRPSAADQASSPFSLNESPKDLDDQHSPYPQPRKTQNSRCPMLGAPRPSPRNLSTDSKPAQQAANKKVHVAKTTLSEPIARVRSGRKLTEEPALEAVTCAEDRPPRVPPRRPSRKGTVDLVTRTSPVVRSNLSPQSLRGYRQQESTVVDPALSAQDTIRETGMDNSLRWSRTKLTHNPSRDLSDLKATPSRLPVAIQTPASTKCGSSTNDSEDQGTQDARGGVLGKLSSRLGLFGRRSKLSRKTTKGEENKERRKGPAAGTGHEIYGKYARRGRRSSIRSASDGTDRSTSTNSCRPFGQRTSHSSAVGSEMNNLIAQRLQPVIIPGGGGGGGGGHNTRQDSGAQTEWQSSDWTARGSEPSLDSGKKLTGELLGSAASDSRSMSATSVASDATSSKAVYPGPTVLSRAIPDRRFPAHVSPPLDGYSTSQSSLSPDQVPGVAEIESSGCSTLRNLTKAGRSRKMLRWNVCRRKAATKEFVKHVEGWGSESEKMSVIVAPVSTDKAPPYYALMDSENENDVENDLGDLLQHIHESPSPSAESTSDGPGLGIRDQYGQSVLLPSMPDLSFEKSRQDVPDSPRPLRKREAQPAGLARPVSPQMGNDKQHRLPQVGRIPRVTSRRDRQHKPPATSFSRPFVRDEVIDTAKMVDDDSVSVAKSQRPIFGIHTDAVASQPFPVPKSGESASAPTGPAGIAALEDYESHPQYLIFPSRNRRGICTASSCGRTLSMTSIAPRTAHRQCTEEDEIWNEYDDLLDHVMSPRIPAHTQKARLSLGEPLVKAAPPRRGEGRPESPLRLGTLSKPRHAAHPKRASSISLRSSSPSTGAEMGHRSRRSMIMSMVGSRSSMSPSSPFSISDYTLAWADRSPNSIDLGQRFNDENPAVAGVVSPPAPSCSMASRKLPETFLYQSTAFSDAAQRDGGGRGGQPDLRFAALTTSRWLSFGRVLFSPAHDVVEANPQQRILVIDGLGNDDWSFYCAETYPTAVVHELTEAADDPAGRRAPSTGSWQAPSNYRKIELGSLAERFPFPQSYFAAAVFRFPAAMSDTIFKMAFSECQRVLRPGGYLELTVLDLDLGNMGTIARHALRDLKARMIGADPEVSLKPASDNIQRILAGRGFENLNRCVVGMPVAAKMGISSTSRSSRSSQDSYHKGAEAEQPAGDGPQRKRRSSHSTRDARQEGSFSPGELFSRHSASSDDEEILAQVGRWWYTRTYEWAVLPRGDLDKSIWKDKRLLRECRARSSGFKLLIAYAQKPVDTRRRTASEPTRTTATISATAM